MTGELITCTFDGDEAEITWRIVGGEVIMHARVHLEWQPEDWDVGISEGYMAESEDDVPENVLQAVAERATDGRYDLAADLLESEARMSALAMPSRGEDL